MPMRIDDKKIAVEELKDIANKQFTFIEVRDVHNSEKTTNLFEISQSFLRLKVFTNHLNISKNLRK